MSWLGVPFGLNCILRKYIHLASRVALTARCLVLASLSGRLVALSKPIDSVGSRRLLFCFVRPQPFAEDRQFEARMADKVKKVKEAVSANMPKGKDMRGLNAFISEIRACMRS